MDDCTPLRRCGKCGIEKPATLEYFKRKKLRGKYGLYSMCKICSVAAERERRQRPEVKARARQSKDSYANRAGWYQTYYQKNKVRLLEYASDYRKRPEVIERQRQYQREYQPGYIRLPESRERSRIKALRRRTAEGKFNKADLELQRRAQTDKKGILRCWWCEKPIGDKYHIDHRIPIAKGGLNYPSNLCITCPQCNMSKKDKLPHEWSDRLL